MTNVEEMARLEEIAQKSKVAVDAGKAKALVGATAVQDKSAPFTVGVADKDGRPIDSPDGFSDPGAPEARGIVFDVHLNEGTEPTTAQMEFYRNLVKIEHALKELYPATDAANEAKFRPFFIRLFFLAQLVLEGDVEKVDGKKKVGKRLSDEAAKAEIAAIANDLIDDEAPRVKNGHLRDLARWAARLSLVVLAAYAVLTLFTREPSGFTRLLLDLNINPVVAANFMLLWVGTFFGVCLSYAMRTHVFSLSDLTRTDSDYLAPQIRLVLAGAFAMVLALVCVVGLGDVQFGTLSLSKLQSMPMLAFIVGTVLGISEQKLSGTIEKRVEGLFSGATK